MKPGAKKIIAHSIPRIGKQVVVVVTNFFVLFTFPHGGFRYQAQNFILLLQTLF